MSDFTQQVDVSHYEFSSYMTKNRWVSIWHQLDEILKCHPKTVLEVGKGTGILGTLLKHYGIDYKCADIDPELNPDIVASVTDLPFEDGSFDVVACFQVLEHIPFELFSDAVSQLMRVARDKVILSLPDAHTLYQYSIHIPKLGDKQISIPRPSIRQKEHHFQGEHYWEINKRGFSLPQVLSNIQRTGGIIESTYRVFEYPYHRFFILRKRI